MLCFNNNTELLKNSPLYVTFNVYSEYSATLYGIEKYIETVRIEDTSQKEFAKSVFENSKAAYCNAQKIDNKYQLLVHSMQYVASIVACSKFIDELDIQVLISKMELSEELYPVINHIFMYKNENDWYYELDKIMRNFVDGGVKIEIQF